MGNQLSGSVGAWLTWFWGGNSKKDDNEILENLLAHPEILESILSNLDLERLKICRLVCRNWNEEISRILRNNSVTSVTKQKEQLRLDRLIRNGELLQLPSPFSSLKMRVQPCAIPDHPHGFSLRPRLQSCLTLVKLTFAVPKNFHFAETLAPSFFELLKGSAATLTHLRTPCWGPIPSGLKEDLKLQKLEALSITASSRKFERPDDEALQFFVTVVAAAPNLSRVQVLSPVVSTRVAEASLERIQSLTVAVDTEGALQECLAGDRGLAHVEIDALTSLSILYQDPRSNDSTSLWLSPETSASISGAIARFSATVEHVKLILDMGVRNPMDCLPRPCPALRDLEFTAHLAGPYNIVKLTGFPGLRRVKVLEQVPIHLLYVSTEEDISWSPSLNVETVSVGRSIFLCSEEESVRLLRMFPNATDWTVGYPMFFSFLHAVAIEPNPAYPLRIEKLTIITDFDLGMSVRAFDEEPQELFLNMLYEDLSKLTELRELRLRISGGALDLDRMGIGRFPKLTTLGFYCEDPRTLIPLVTSREWRKLERIIILNPLDRHHASEMERLFCKCPALTYGFKYPEFP